MDHHYLKKQIKNNMSKTTIAIIIYVLGLIFGALVLDLWSAETSPKALLRNDLDCIISYCFIFCRIQKQIGNKIRQYNFNIYKFIS